MALLYVEFIDCMFYSTVCGFSLLFDWFVGYRHSLTYTVVKLLKIFHRLNFMQLGIKYTCGQLHTHTHTHTHIQWSPVEIQIPVRWSMISSFLLLRSSHCIFIPTKVQCKCKQKYFAANFLFKILKVV